MDFTYCSVCLNFMCIHINYICTIRTCTVIKGRLNRLRTVLPFPGPFCIETVLEGHHFDSNWTTSGFANSQNATLRLRTSQLADWTSCGLRSGVLQAGSDSSLVSEWPCSTVLTLGDSCIPATINFLQYHVPGSILMVAGPFQWPAPQSRALSQILSLT